MLIFAKSIMIPYPRHELYLALLRPGHRLTAYYRSTTSRAASGHTASALERFPAPGWDILLRWLGRVCTSSAAAQVIIRLPVAHAVCPGFSVCAHAIPSKLMHACRPTAVYISPSPERFNLYPVRRQYRLR